MKAQNKRLRPSAAARWLACPGSIGLIEKMEERGLPTDKESETAILGTRAHSYAEARIKSMFYPQTVRETWATAAEKVRDQMPEELIQNAEKHVSWVTQFLFGQTGEGEE